MLTSIGVNVIIKMHSVECMKRHDKERSGPESSSNDRTDLAVVTN